METVGGVTQAVDRSSIGEPGSELVLPIPLLIRLLQRLPHFTDLYHTAAGFQHLSDSGVKVAQGKLKL